jgi:single-strand DNA-binding protein
MNSITITGRLGAEPTVRTTKEATIARISLGVNSKKDKVEETEWLEIILWNRLALVAQQYYHTGDKVYIKGHLSSSSYEDKEGTTHYVTQIVADDMEKLSTAKRNIQGQEKQD